MSAAWLLSQHHDVTVYEGDRRVGGHSNTVTVAGAKGEIAVDTGFIVYNEADLSRISPLCSTILASRRSHPTCPLPCRWRTANWNIPAPRCPACSPQKRNLFRPRFWSMLRGPARASIARRRAISRVLDEFHTTLGDYLDAGAYGHAVPATIICCRWRRRSGRRRRARCSTIRPHPSSASTTITASCKLRNRPPWRTVLGGSRAYVERLTRSYAGPHPACGRGHRRASLRRLRQVRDRDGACRDVRPCRDRQPCRSGAGDARRSDGAGAAASRRFPLQRAISRCCTPIRR